jgi:hypothetical protein
LTFAGIIRGLHRIELAIHETSSTPLARLLQKSLKAPQ